jgi:hypothetical protein
LRCRGRVRNAGQWQEEDEQDRRHETSVGDHGYLLALEFLG